MAELPIGILCLAVWAVLQFKVQPATAWYHILLAAGVILAVRGIARSRWGTPEPR
ncbi:MAG: hypothetical protein ABIZ70_00390 [Gemmatimonadales bacterium]